MFGVFNRLILAAVILACPVVVAAPAKITLVIYLDLSASMGQHRNQLANMAEGITSELTAKCGDYEILVNNLHYASEYIQGGEVIKASENEPDWITKNTYNRDLLLKSRIRYDSNIASFLGATVFEADSRERTYTSVVDSIKEKLGSAPSGYLNPSALGVLILTDAAPVFEVLNPEEASLKFVEEIGPRKRYMVGSLGAKSESCMDFRYPEESKSTLEPQADLDKVSWLQEFTRLNRGYNWDICSTDRNKEMELLEQSVKDYMIMLMEEAKCQVNT